MLLACIQISQEARKVVWHSYFLKNFPQFVVSHTVKDFNVDNEAEVDVFLEFFCFFYDLMESGQFDLRFLCFFQILVEHLESCFFVHALLKPSLENFEHYLASM